MIENRFKWNPKEDTASLVAGLAELTDDETKKQRLKNIARELKEKFSGMQDQPSKEIFDKEIQKLIR